MRQCRLCPLIARAEDECRRCLLQVINAYMSLLSMRSMMRCTKYSDGKAEVLEIEDADGEHDDMEGDGLHVQGRKMTARGQSGARRQGGKASSESPDDGRTRSKAAQASGEETTASKAPPKCVFFSSFFYAILRNAKKGYGVADVRRWSQNKVLCEHVLPDKRLHILPLKYTSATASCGGAHLRPSEVV